jgi:hypothetical protein
MWIVSGMVKLQPFVPRLTVRWHVCAESLQTRQIEFRSCTSARAHGVPTLPLVTGSLGHGEIRQGNRPARKATAIAHLTQAI